jgi:hypothetical protein
MYEELKPDIYSQRLNRLVRHISHVQENCLIIAERLIETEGNQKFTLELMANASIHDRSKFEGIEWLYLNEEAKEKTPELFKAAHYQHVSTNPHHSEYWSSIHDMPDIYVAEFVADCKARSGEFGTDLREWMKKKATKQYNFKVQSKVYRTIKKYMDLLLDPAFGDK